MKKYAITSICTLVLSLLGAFGLNQNSLNSNANSIATDTVENIQYIDDNQSLQDDNQTKAAKVNADVKTATVNKEETAEQATPVANLNSEKCTVKNGQIYFGNINLSECKTVEDVVKILNTHGYANVTADNIKNVKSLQDVLKYINNSSANTAAQGGSSNTPSQTTVNTPTSKPAPTKAPTKAPAPTKTPTTTPSATTPTKAPSTTTPTKAPTKAPATAPANTGISSFAGEVLRLVNVERAKAGLPALTTNSTLTAAANKRAQETKQSFSHTRPNGSSAFTVLGEYGVSYRTAGENIAYGQKNPQEVVNGWMNSPGHRANIMNSNFGKVGIGVYESNGVIYWTQLFTD